MNYLQKKKLAFLSIVNKVKGFVKTVVGIPPLILPNCVDEDSVINYKIYGESKQNGTPSPDAPVEIESVGEKTNNLLDLSVMANDFAVLNDDGSMTFEIILNENGSTKSRMSNYMPVHLKRNTPYCLEGIIEEGNTSQSFQNVGFLVLDENKNQIISTGLGAGGIENRTLFVSKDAYYVRFYLGAGITGSVRASNIRLIESEHVLFKIVDEVINEYAEFDVKPASSDYTDIGWYGCTVTIPDNNTETQFLIRYLDESGNIIVSNRVKSGDSRNTVSADTCKKVSKIRIYAGSSADLAVGKSITISYYLNTGNPHGYEPYGYKIPVKAKGKNLFDVYRWLSDYIDEDGKVRYTNADYTNIYKIKILEGEFKENTQYTFSVNYELTKKVESAYGVIIRFNMSDGTVVIKRLPDSSGVGTYTGNCSITNKADTTVLSACIAYNNASYEAEVLLSDIQITEGTATAEYEPYVEPITTNIYLDEPLRKIGDYADCVDFENGKVIRNIKSINAEANGWSGYNDGGGKYATKAYILPIATLVNNYGYHCVCNRFIGKTRMNIYNGIEGIAANDLQIRLYYVGITDISIKDFQDWVSENPISVDYILSEPIEEDIELPKLPTFKGTTIYEVDTNIQPSNMEVAYYSSQKGE